MKLSEFDYHLPASFIAQQPLLDRDHSKLMCLDRAHRLISHHQFFELPKLLDSNSVLVFNQSKVIPARLQFALGNNLAEILLVKPVADKRWECMVRPGRKFQPGSCFSVDEELSVVVDSITTHGLRVIDFEVSDLNLYLKQKGQTPLPPYVKESIGDPDRYQTIYAKDEGSVAAPTAGFHFTQKVFDDLQQKGIEKAFVTLHVGLGTFQPVKTQEIEAHQMHAEYFELSEVTANFLNQAKQSGKKIIAVGTTAVRVLESCSDEKGFLSAYSGETDIFVTPGYQWKFVDGLITNFHVPKSTLLMLVSALAGREFIFEAYQEAKRKHYRFFSFGDAMLIL